jgi:uncharacterized protein (UPF0332 family)
MKKHELDQKSIDALVVYRLERANETLLEAQTLIENNFFNAAVNRIYYACYYAVIALLVKNRISAHSHSGVKQMLGLHFVVNGKLSPENSRFYNQIFNDRITGDYDDFITYEKKMVEEMLPKAKSLITAISQLIGQ